MYIDTYYIVLVVPALIIAMLAQAKVKSTFGKYNKVRTKSGVTGAEVARKILDANGLNSVRIERIDGNLTDHFDPTKGVIRLSQATHDSASVGAAGVAAHEAGHAVQYAEEYAPIKLRAALIPITNFGATLSWPMVLLGFVMQISWLVSAGIILFATSTLSSLSRFRLSLMRASAPSPCSTATAFSNPTRLEAQKKCSVPPR